MVSIIILTHNANDYIKITLESLKKTKYVDYEVIVVDNDSEINTQKMLVEYKEKGYIDKLLLLNENTFFAKGNNIGFNLVSNKSDWIVLLNSDIEIKSELWLKKLFDITEQNKQIAGIGYGYGMTPKGRHMADGYCILLKKSLYAKFRLNEEYEWWFGIGELESKILKEGYRVIAINNHEDYIHHFGGKSGNAWKKAKGMDKSKDYFDEIFKGRKQVECIYDLDRTIGSNLKEINCFRGLYDDGWCAENSDFEIRTLEKGNIYIEGYYPAQINGNQHIDIKVGRKNYKFTLKEENFVLQIKTKKDCVVRVHMECGFAAKWSDNDIREMAFVVKDIRAE